MIAVKSGKLRWDLPTQRRNLNESRSARLALIRFKLRPDTNVGLVVAQQTIETPDDSPIRRNQYGSREPDKSTEFLGGCVVADQNGVVHVSALFTELEPLVLDERSDNTFSFFVHSHTQYGEPPGTVFILQLYEPGYLEPAREAPRGPKIHQDKIAFELAEGNFVVFQVLQSKVWGGRGFVHICFCRAGLRNARGPILQQSGIYNSSQRRNDHSNSFHVRLLTA